MGNRIKGWEMKCTKPQAIFKVHTDWVATLPAGGLFLWLKDRNCCVPGLVVTTESLCFLVCPCSSVIEEAQCFCWYKGAERTAIGSARSPFLFLSSHFSRCFIPFFPLTWELACSFISSKPSPSADAEQAGQIVFWLMIITSKVS